MRAYLFHLFFLLVFVHASYAQQLQIRGKVVDEKRTAITGALVKITAGKSSVATDEKGNFQLLIEKVPVVINVAAVGYKSLDVKIRSADTGKIVEIVLKIAKESLEEVIVVGYGTRDFESVVFAKSYDKALSGKVSGVSIRGVSSSMSRKSEATISYKSGVKSAPGFLTDDTVSSKIKPGMLTAGELSDFKKWKLWSNYTKEEFQQWKRHWGINLQNRYCVQVLNKDLKAVVNEKVYLLSSVTGDTAWQAITDNTGKAELWDDLDSGTSKPNKYLISCDNQKLNRPVLFENGINRILLNKSCNVFTAADIAFVVDATGSMGDEIRYLQTELTDIVNAISVQHKDISLRTGSVFYRDHGDEYLTRFSALSNKPEKLTAFIAKQSAGAAVMDQKP